MEKDGSNLIVKLQDLLVYEGLGIKIGKEYAQYIKKLIRSKFGSQKRAALLNGLNHVTIGRIEWKSTRIYHWKKILNLLDIDLNEFEKHVVGIADWKIYNIKFPYSVSPLLIRLVAHTIGDGGFYLHNAQWIQKKVAPIINLQKQLLGVYGKIVINCNEVEHTSIMALYIKLACAVLGIQRNEISSAKFIRACMKLPKDYKVQTLAAVIEDEGRIQPNSGSMIITMKDSDIVKSLAKLMENLGYDHSRITKTKNLEFSSSRKNSPSRQNGFLYRVNLRILGAHKFYHDLNEIISKYGELAGLWKKQKQLQNLMSSNDGRKARGEKLNRDLAKKTINLMKKNSEKITYKELKKYLNVSHHRTGSVVRRLYNKKILKKVSRGYYTLIK